MFMIIQWYHMFMIIQWYRIFMIVQWYRMFMIVQWYHMFMIIQWCHTFVVGNVWRNRITRCAFWVSGSLYVVMDDQIVFFCLAQTGVLASLVIRGIGFCVGHLSRACSRLRGIWGWLWFSCGVARCGVV